MASQQKSDRDFVICTEQMLYLQKKLISMIPKGSQEYRRYEEV